MHDAFVAVWRKIDRFDADRGSLRAWLMTVVRNRAIDRIRARRPEMDLDDADERSLLRTGPNPTWEDGAPAGTSATEVRAAMAALPDEQRRAVELAYFEGYTYREVAEVTGVPPGTANGRLRLALAKLRDALAGTSGAPLTATVTARHSPRSWADDLRAQTRRARRRLRARGDSSPTRSAPSASTWRPAPSRTSRRATLVGAALGAAGGARAGRRRPPRSGRA